MGMQPHLLRTQNKYYMHIVHVILFSYIV